MTYKIFIIQLYWHTLSTVTYLHRLATTTPKTPSNTNPLNTHSCFQLCSTFMGELIIIAAHAVFK